MSSGQLMLGSVKVQAEFDTLKVNEKRTVKIKNNWDMIWQPFQSKNIKLNVICWKLTHTTYRPINIDGTNPTQTKRFFWFQAQRVDEPKQFMFCI